MRPYCCLITDTVNLLRTCWAMSWIHTKAVTMKTKLNKFNYYYCRYLTTVFQQVPKSNISNQNSSGNISSGSRVVGNRGNVTPPAWAYGENKFFFKTGGARLQIFKKLRGPVCRFLKKLGGPGPPQAPIDGTPLPPRNPENLQRVGNSLRLSQQWESILGKFR